MSKLTAKAFPAIRSHMGDRWYYTATMTFGEVDEYVKPVPKIDEDESLKMWIQRELRSERTAQIAKYLNSQPQRFFNAIVLGMYGGEPDWIPITVSKGTSVQEVDLNERLERSFGFIQFSGDETVFAVDGQHRVEGIRAAIIGNNQLAQDEQTVIFVAHHADDVGRERTRRLFSTLNKYAVPVAESEKIALSEDDMFAIATRQLIDNYKSFNMKFVPLLPSASIPNHEVTCVTTVVGLYRLARFLSPIEIRRERKKVETGPANPDVIKQIYQCSADFWTALKKHVDPIRKVLASSPERHLAANYRHKEGGHLLFRSVGLDAFARATRVLQDRGRTVDEAVSALSKVSLDITAPLWEGLLWRSENNTILHKYGILALNVFLKQIGETPAPNGYNVAAKYLHVTGNEYPRKVKIVAR